MIPTIIFLMAAYLAYKIRAHNKKKQKKKIHSVDRFSRFLALGMTDGKSFVPYERIEG